MGCSSTRCCWLFLACNELPLTSFALTMFSSLLGMASTWILKIFFFFGCYRKYQACMKENSVTTPHVSVTQQQQLTQGLSCFFFTPASTPVGHFWSTLREHIISFINIVVCSSKRERSVFDNQNTTIKKFFLDVPHDMWNLSAQTRDGTCAACIESSES